MKYKNIISFSPSGIIYSNDIICYGNSLTQQINNNYVTLSYYINNLNNKINNNFLTLSNYITSSYKLISGYLYLTLSNHVNTASGLIGICNDSIHLCDNAVSNCKVAISNVRIAEKACIGATTAYGIATLACTAATLLSVPGPPGPPGISIQGQKSDKGDSVKGDKSEYGDSYFTQNENNIVTQNNLIIQDNFNDNIVNLSNSLNSQCDFYNNVQYHKDVIIDGNITNTNFNNSLNPLIGNNEFLGAVHFSTNSVIKGATINIGSSPSNVFINRNLFLNGGLVYRSSSGYSNAVSMVEYISQI